MGRPSDQPKPQSRTRKGRSVSGGPDARLVWERSGREEPGTGGERSRKGGRFRDKAAGPGQCPNRRVTGTGRRPGEKRIRTQPQQMQRRPDAARDPRHSSGPGIERELQDGGHPAGGDPVVSGLGKCFSEPAAPRDRKRFSQQHERYSAKAMSAFALFGAPTIIAPTIIAPTISKPAKTPPCQSGSFAAIVRHVRRRIWGAEDRKVYCFAKTLSMT